MMNFRATGESFLAGLIKPAAKVAVPALSVQEEATSPRIAPALVIIPPVTESARACTY